MKVFLFAGARPNFMKIAPIYRALIELSPAGNPDSLPSVFSVVNVWKNVPSTWKYRICLKLWWRSSKDLNLSRG